MQLWTYISVLFFAINTACGQSIQITEIFADPTPSKGLPEREFIEIYNPTNTTFSLKGYKLVYGKTIVILPDSTIGSGEFAILCRATYTNEFSTYGQTVGLTNLSLNNSGTVLRLLNPKDEELQYVPYSTDWYSPGLSEGYSLEMIDLAYPCVGKSNWASSKAEKGATPGKPNSVTRENPDNSAPTLVEYTLFENEILLVFNEILNTSFIEDINNFEIITGNRSLQAVGFYENQRHIVVITIEGEEENSLGLQIYNARDCSGNTAEDIYLNFLKLPEPQMGDIQISEILFNPKIGGEDFVELHNNTGQSFNLKNWKISSLNSSGKMAGITLLSAYDLELEPQSYMAFTKNRKQLQDNYPFTGNIKELGTFPIYNNESGTVYLMRPDSSIFDQFAYNEKMHSFLINNPDGVSLEKVSFRRNQNTWNSASKDVGYATPGIKNSQSENDFLEQKFYTEPLVFDPNSNSLAPETNLKYNLSSSGNYASISIVDRTGKNVKSFGSNILLGTEGAIPWDGTDNSGRILPIGYYVFVIKVFNKGFEESYYAKTVLASK